MPMRLLNNFTTKNAAPSSKGYGNQNNRAIAPITNNYTMTITNNENAPVVAVSEQRLPAMNLCGSKTACIGQGTNTAFIELPTAITQHNAKSFFQFDHTPISFKGGHCLGNNFAYATAIPFDIDNSHSDDPADWISPDAIRAQLEQLGINFWMCASRNHLLPKDGKDVRPKFHVYLPLSSPLKDSDGFVLFCKWCIKTFNTDPQVKSKSQKIFGYGNNPNAFVEHWGCGRCVDEVIGADDLTAVAAPLVSVPKDKTDIPLPILPVDMTATERQAIAYINAMPEAVQGCNGSADALRICNKLFEFGLDREVAKEVFLTHYNPRCKPAWSEREIDHKLDTAYSKPLKASGCMLGYQTTDAKPSWQPFPVEVFPSKTKRFIQETAASIGIDPAFIGPPMLSAYSGLIGRSCRIQLKKGYSEQSSIWTVTVASSGSGKTPALDAVLTPIREYQRLADDKFKQELRTYEAKTQGKRKNNPDVCMANLPSPVPEQILIGDVTTEAVAEILEDNPRGCALFQDELSCFLGGFDAYRPSGAAGKDLGFWLSVFNGVPVRVNRKTGNKLISASTPAVAICGGIQPGMIRKILAKNEHFFEAGLMARVLAVSPPESPVMWTDNEVSVETAQGYKLIIGRLLNLRKMIPSTPENPTVVKLSDEAKKRWTVFYNANATEQQTVATEAGRAAWAKLPAYAARIALVLHIIEYVEEADGYSIPEKVSAQTLEAAIKLVEWFKGESARLLATFRNQSSFQFDREASAIFDTIQRKGQVTKADLHCHRVFRNAPNPAGAIDAKLAELRESGEIVSAFEKSPNGGYGKEVFRLPSVASGSITTEISGEYASGTATANGKA